MRHSRKALHTKLFSILAFEATAFLWPVPPGLTKNICATNKTKAQSQVRGLAFLNFNLD